MKIIHIYQRIEERASKVEFMVTVLSSEISKNMEIFLDVEVVSDIN